LEGFAENFQGRSWPGVECKMPRENRLYRDSTEYLSVTFVRVSKQHVKYVLTKHEALQHDCVGMLSGNEDNLTRNS